MNPSARSSRLVSGAAVAAVCIVALATVWTERSAPQVAVQAQQPPAVQAQRPAADAPVRVVAAPPDAQPGKHTVGCRDCATGVAPRENRL